MSDTSILYHSLLRCPLLIDHLPEAKIFQNQSLQTHKSLPILNFEQKLGHLYEDALAELLNSTPDYNTLERSLQIREPSGRTLGELDFLIEDLNTHQLIHLELAVKFYLAVETEETLLLPGPDSRDNYFRKLERMRTHQLTLTQRFHHLLPHIYQNREIKVEQLVYGCIFQHIHSEDISEVNYLNPHGRRGRWLHLSEAPDYFVKNETLEVIPKHLWPADPELLSPIELEKWNLPSELERCVMVRAKSDQTQTYFITPDNYPLMS